MVQKTMAQSRSVVLAADHSVIPVQVASGSVTDKEIVVSTYFVKTAFAGASIGDTVTCTQVLDITGSTSTTTATIWRNQTTASDFASPPAASNLQLVGASALTDAQLRLAPVPIVKGNQTVSECTISSGQSLSAAVDLGSYRLVGISTPNTLTPTTLTFQASYDNVTWNNVYESTGAEKTISVAASRRIVLSPADFYGIRYIKIRGGTSASPATVASDTTIRLIAEG